MSDEALSPGSDMKAPEPGSSEFDAFLTRASAFLDEETLAKVSSTGDLLHYLVNQVGGQEEKPEGFLELMGDIKAADPSQQGKEELREVFRAEIANLQNEYTAIVLWIDMNSKRLADDPEMAAKLARHSEILGLLGRW